MIRLFRLGIPCTTPSLLFTEEHRKNEVPHIKIIKKIDIKDDTITVCSGSQVDEHGMNEVPLKRNSIIICIYIHMINCKTIFNFGG